MIAARVSLLFVFVGILAAIIIQWHFAVGFDPQDLRWWEWVAKVAFHPTGLPPEMLNAVYFAGAGGVVGMFLVVAIATRARNRTLGGGRDGDELHGSARWANRKDVANAGLFNDKGVTVGGWRGRTGTVEPMRHDGPEHVMVFAPTRSGKGVSLILPTLLTWPASVFVLDIKGENHALTAGWRARQGHAVFKFEPTTTGFTAKFNPLAEVRIGTGRDIADCQNIAAMIIDPDGKGLRDYWRQEGWTWLSVVLLHVIYRVKKEEGRRACLDDVNIFASGTISHESGEDDFDALLDEMLSYRHGEDYIDKEVKRGASRMKIKAPQERSGVHSSAITELALYADPIIAKNTASSDFSLNDLVNGSKPAAFYMIVRPSDIDRLRPLVRIVMNLLLRRLTEEMEFENGRAKTSYKHRLLLMLDEFTSIGKLEIFERALAFMAGYGLKAFLVVQDITQLHQAYGREESIMSNCHVRIAFAPNKIETARVLSDMTGKATVVQARRSRSGRLGELGSVSENLHETSRPLLTADECLRLRGIETDGGKARPGEVLVFAGGTPPIRGVQTLYFQDKELSARAGIQPPGDA